MATRRVGRLILWALAAAPPAIAQYNPPDCAYPAATPAISEVDGDGVGPWVSAAGHTLVINALGDQLVPNNAYSGPSATTAPFNQKTVTRHYGFGIGCFSPTPGNATCNTLSRVTIGGVAAPITSWSDATIAVIVPSGVPVCAIQQQAQYGGSRAECGELAITAGNGQRSIDTVTVTIGGKAPTYVTRTIQSAIDAAAPGDLIMVRPGTYNEMVLMWKPVRLQAVAAAASVINSRSSATQLAAWRVQVNCLFGLALNGQPISATNPFDPTNAALCPGAGWQYFAPSANNPQVDRLPLEVLQEPSLMGALEGAGITVLSKGVFFPSNPFDSTLLAGFPTGTVPFTSGNTGNYCNGSYPSNFHCNPSGIDGLGITNSSQGGGGIFVHGWGHNIQIANNRIYNNHGSLAGGISVGRGEFAAAYLQGSSTNPPPGSCESAAFPGVQLPDCFDVQVNVHNNSVTSNLSIGDESLSGTPVGAGGVAFCTGADYYKFDFNWVCGNQGSGAGGGVGHRGFSKNADIEYNTIVFNRGVGLKLAGSAATPDNDLGDGVGPGTVVNANLIIGNDGGMTMQQVNGTEVSRFPLIPGQWYSIRVTNNIIANNVAADGAGGVSLQDALKVLVINNTIVGNDSTASAAGLFPSSLMPGTTSKPQPAGVEIFHNSEALKEVMLGQQIVCPAGFYSGSNAINGTCTQISYPRLANNVFWQNRSFDISVGPFNSQTQQYPVTLLNAFSGTLAVSQPPPTGACVSASFWDIGVRGDTGPANHTSGFMLTPMYSVLTDAADYPGANNLGSNPNFVSQYCNGARIPPEEAVSPPLGLAPFATVDDGRLMINLAWGPLSLTNSVTGTVLGNYALAAGSPAIDYVSAVAAGASNFPTTDFFGNPRPDPANPNQIDIGAVEFQGNGSAIQPLLTSITPNSGLRGTSVNVTLTGTGLTGVSAVNPPGSPTITVSNVVVVNDTAVRATLTLASGTPLGAHNINVSTPSFTSNNVTFFVLGSTLTAISPNSGHRGTTVAVTITGTGLTGASAVAISGAGIACAIIGTPTATTVNASCVITSTATLGLRDVSVTTPIGVATGTGLFTVLGP